MNTNNNSENYTRKSNDDDSQSLDSNYSSYDDYSQPLDFSYDNSQSYLKFICQHEQDAEQKKKELEEYLTVKVNFFLKKKKEVFNYA